LVRTDRCAACASSLARRCPPAVSAPAAGSVSAGAPRLPPPMTGVRWCAVGSSAVSDLEFLILGPLVVNRRGEPISIGPPRQSRLLGGLLLRAGRVSSIDRLVDVIWGDDPPDATEGALQSYVSRLRKVLDIGGDGQPSLLRRQPPGYLLDVDPDTIDATRYEATLGRIGDLVARSAAHAEILQCLDAARALWRGELLADLGEASWLQATRARFSEMAWTAAEQRCTSLLALGRSADALLEADVLVREQPLRERAHAMFILALYRCGRQGEALRACADARAVLVDQLGIEPGTELRALQSAVLDQDPDLDWRADTSAAVTPSRRSAVSRPPLLVGRSAEVARIGGIIQSHGRFAVVVLEGEAGVGKSTLIRHLVADAEQHQCRVAVGRCQNTESPPAYWPWLEIVRQLTDQPDLPSLPTLLSAAVRDAIRDELVGARESTYLVHSAVVGIIESAAAEERLVAVIEDLHWADHASLRLLEQLTASARTDALVVLVTLRPGSPASATLAQLGRSEDRVRVPLGGLGEAASNELLSAVWGDDVYPKTSSARPIVALVAIRCSSESWPPTPKR
jgi:DNA-binding SARP family transcriptional activator